MLEPDLFTIEFQGEALPPPMCCVDVASGCGHLADIPDDTQEWMWRFTVCLDSERTAASKDVRRHAGVLRAAITDSRDALLIALLNTGRDVDTAQAHIAAWETGLDRMCELSRSTKTCRWIGRASAPPQ